MEIPDFGDCDALAVAVHLRPPYDCIQYATSITMTWITCPAFELNGGHKEGVPTWDA